MKKPFMLLTLLCLLLIILLGGLIGLTNLNRPFLNQQSVQFSDAEGNNLVGAYLSGTEPVGVLFLEGFGSDQIAMRPAAHVFQTAGAHIFTFDFSGHGQSGGMLGFDNAATDRLARQTLVAKEVFKSISGLADTQLIVFGHSLGARVALQSALIDPNPPRALVLAGAQVNLATNVQSEFFTGTRDVDMAWVNSLSASEPESDIILLSGSWDDILTPEAAELLYQKLGGDEAPGRELTIIPYLLHNYEIYSARLFEQAATSLERWGVISFPQPPSLSAYYWFGALALIGLLGSLTTAGLLMTIQMPLPPSVPSSVTIQRQGRFLWGKLYLWLAAVPIAAILSSLFFLLRLGLPVFNLIYVGFIGGYGLLMFVLYLFGKVPGTEGKWQLKRWHPPMRSILKDQRFWSGIMVWLGVWAACVLLTRAGLFYVIAPNQRLIWLVLFTPITALGFWIGAQEAKMIAVFRHESGRKLPTANILLIVISLMPFFIFTLLMAIIGSLSGAVGGLQGLLILTIVILTGKLLDHFIRSPLMVALLQALLLYALILPQGVLFAF